MQENEVLILSNGQKYLVISEIQYQEIHYDYLMNLDDYGDIKIVKKNINKKVEEITNLSLIDQLLSFFLIDIRKNPK